MKKWILLLLCSVPQFLVAQKQANVWYFGDKAGLDFSSGTPIPLSNGQIGYGNGINHMEGTAVISDSSGKMLFYTEGMHVWNKNHVQMPNGSGLLGNYSSTQSSTIVPDPTDPNRYFYLFTVSSGFCCNGNITDGLRYSKIDMCLEEELGDVLPTEKNVKLVDTVTEKIAVTQHANGIDYWIVTHKFYSNQFWALRLTATGITDTVISAIGSLHTGAISRTQGQLKFSNTGNKIIIGGSNGMDVLDVFDFDKTSGMLSNAKSIKKINNDHVSVFGVEFSADDSKLYVNGLTSLGLMYASFVQYDLSAGGGNIDSINASVYVIYKDTVGLMAPCGLQIGPDQKIYHVSINDQTKLSVVINPNAAGAACDYQDQAITLAAGTKGSYTLPSFIAGFDYNNALTQCDIVEPNSLNDVEESVDFICSPNPFSEKLTIHISPSLQIKTLRLINCVGVVVRNIPIGSDKIITIQRDQLPAGMYFISYIDSANMAHLQKVCIMD
ncbi:MAG: T9SS type A sorting domain-containing protein [Bacteroidetes bacterium]|nr:T9SS type A sorting domain-containing protein [Bacteroidota bacterium]MBP6314010.1 T9SS type A sorting domain-containing protein [Chitinophagaceae bacterium]